MDACTASRPRPRRWPARPTLVRGARRPLIVAGGGVIYSEATAALRAFAEATGIPVCETQAGRGALVSDHPLSLGAVGATGTTAANRLAREADVVIGDRHALERLHDRVEVGLPGPRRALRQHQRRVVRRVQAQRPAARRRRARRARRAARGARRSPGAGGLGAARRRGGGRLGRRGRAPRRGARGRRRGHCRPARPGGDHRRRQRRRGRDRRGRLRRRVDARRPAQAVARPRPEARATTSSTATRAWATRSRAAWASSSPRPSARSSSWSATART